MSNASVIAKIKKAKLVGRGGASYPTWQKWQAVLEAPINDTTSESGIDVTAGKYVVCNCSEGEPGVKKDAYLIEKHIDRVIDGMRIAIDLLGAKKGYFYLNETYYKKYKKRIEQAIKASGSPIALFKKDHVAGYIGGEESSILNVIEGGRAEPRIKPPYPVTHGLYGQPTLINNVETFYDVSRAVGGDYQPTRLYTLSGDVINDGVYELPINLSVEKVLETTKNFPKFDFFVQVGGDGSGVVLSRKQLNKPADGAGSIRVYSLEKHSPIKLIRGWVNFFVYESCGKCTPCREGTYRIAELLGEPHPDWQQIRELLDNLSDTAFCALGMSVPIPIRSYVANVLKPTKGYDFKMRPEERQIICDYLS